MQQTEEIPPPVSVTGVDTWYEEHPAVQQKYHYPIYHHAVKEHIHFFVFAEIPQK